jgi:hypothetical protein
VLSISQGTFFLSFTSPTFLPSEPVSILRKSDTSMMRRSDGAETDLTDRMATDCVNIGDQMAAWHATKRQIHELTEKLKFVRDCSSKGVRTPELDADGRKLVTTLTQLYELQDSQLAFLQQTVDKARDEHRSAGLTPNGAMPIEQLQTRLDTFMRTKLPLVGPPFGPFCGRIQPDKRDVIPPGSFVCIKSPVRHQEQYILGMVTDYSAGTYFVLDVAPEGRSRPRFRRKRCSLQVMPKVLPKQLNTLACYRPHEPVLALYRLEDGEWTTMFYAAEIIRTPAMRGRGYIVHYTGDGRKFFTVPEGFIVSKPGDEEEQ